MTDLCTQNNTLWLTHLPMPSDIFSILNRSKSSVTKVASKKSVSPLVDRNIGIRSITSSSKSHTFTIIDQYLIKIKPKAFVKPDGDILMSEGIVSFDLDGTLIQTKSSAKFARSPDDWRWFNDQVLCTLKAITAPIVIFTNQGGVVAQKSSKSYTNLTKRLELILADLEKNGVDITKIWIYASPKKSAAYKGKSSEMFDKMRKPNLGMFEEFEKDYGSEISKAKSIFVGDAAGRADDFSDSDMKFAENIGMDFKVPEDYFV